MTTDDENLFGQEHVRIYRETGGERGYSWRNGTKILLLSTIGHSSGEERTTPLIHREDAGRWVVVASKGGAPDDPAWYRNLKANPEATIQVKSETIPVSGAPIARSPWSCSNVAEAAALSASVRAGLRRQPGARRGLGRPSRRRGRARLR
jgi:deazaflavin-dependent oxidoreductase (nitroreductase family)